MRIVSLLPAGTDWVCALGAAEQLVGRSHECEVPFEGESSEGSSAAIEDVPVVTEATFEKDLPDGSDSAAIDRAVQGTLREGLSLYEVDLEKLQALAPDVVLTQAQCEVCAVSLPQLESMLATWTSATPQLMSLSPMTLKAVMEAGLRIGRAIDRVEEAMQFLAREEKRLKMLRDRLRLERATDPQRLPTVGCVEWMEPLMTAGHWAPDVVEMAGARAVLAEAGAPSQCVEWNALRTEDPDVLALMPCGFSLEETRRDVHYLTGREGFRDLKAVRNERVFLFDGNAYFNRPGPRLYRAIELLAGALYPDALAGTIDAEPWERCRLDDLDEGGVA